MDYAKAEELYADVYELNRKLTEITDKMDRRDMKDRNGRFHEKQVRYSMTREQLEEIKCTLGHVQLALAAEHVDLVCK